MNAVYVTLKDKLSEIDNAASTVKQEISWHEERLLDKQGLLQTLEAQHKEIRQHLISMQEKSSA